jgi:hypothetical protein
MITLPNKLGLVDFLQAQGWALRFRDGNCFGRSPAGIEDDPALTALAASYNELPAIKVARIASIKADGLVRIQAVYASIRGFDDLQLVSDIILSIIPAARQLTADMTKAAAIWNAGKAAIASVNAATTVVQVAAVVPAWPA